MILSENRMGLEEVTYNRLESGEFMREWLILEPITPCQPAWKEYTGTYRYEKPPIEKETRITALK